ncbi:hypothetical protein KDL30_16120 [bacterium]|nr:hypothetical protein [bacterium]
MPRHRIDRTPRSRQGELPGPPRFSTQQLTIAVVVVFALFIGTSWFLSNYTPGRLSPDRSYVLPAGWPFPGLVPPRGSRAAVSQDFLAISPAASGLSFETTEDGELKRGISFEHSAEPQRVVDYFGEMLAEAKYVNGGRKSTGRNSENVLSVWNSEYGNISIVLSGFEGRYELVVIGN